ncbi:hypothetical protein [Rhizobium leguminosarum]
MQQRQRQLDLPAAAIEALFAAERDLADVKLSVDHLVDASNTEAGIAMIDRMTAEARMMLPENARRDEDPRGAASLSLRSRRLAQGLGVFSCDQSDPLGIKAANRKLLRYLEAFTCNCIIMLMQILFMEGVSA